MRLLREHAKPVFQERISATSPPARDTGFSSEAVAVQLREPTRHGYRHTQHVHPFIRENFAALFEESLARRRCARASSSPPKCPRRLQHRRRQRGTQVRELHPIEEFKNDKGEVEVKPGDFVTVAIESLEDGYGETRCRATRPSASRRGTISRPRWSRARRHRTGHRQGEGRPDRDGKRHPRVPARLARRHTSGQGHLALRGKALEFKVIKLDRKRNNVVVSRRAVLEASLGEEREKLARRCRKARSSRASSRTSPITARSSTWAASTACCTSPISPGGASSIPRKFCRWATK
jgi:hypothetical protein